MPIIHIGLDSHDTPKGGCTTHFSILLIKELLKLGVEFIDYPNLIRLNPSIPWKTRGNGAVVLRLKVPENKLAEVLDIAKNLSKEYTGKEYFKYRQPGLAVYIGKDIPHQLRVLYRKALTDVVPLDVALSIASKVGVKILVPKTHRGLVGAISSIGALQDLREDYTFELLAYRSRDYVGLRQRLIDKESVKQVELEYRDTLFNNYDFEFDEAVITPHGPDPVLFGLRGNDPEVLVKALSKIRVLEPISAWCIFRSNQATDAHLVYRRISELRPYQTCMVKATVVSKPEAIKGGHVRLMISDGSGKIYAYFYEPTSTLRKIALKLIPGDQIIVGGSVRPPSRSHPYKSINVEKLVIEKIVDTILRNPKCPRCGKTMKSAGRNKGFKCPKCGYKSNMLSKIPIKISRDVRPGIYTPPIRSMHHLSKPISRIKHENTGHRIKLIDKWCEITSL